jgi:hypothetical protein
MPEIESELMRLAAHVDHGTLPDHQLDKLLGWVETSPREHREKYKLLAAAAIHRQHNGRYVARGCAWVSCDGANLRAELR